MAVESISLQSVAPRRRRRRGTRAAAERRLGLILLLPSVILLTAIVAYPLGYSLYLSLFHDNLLHPESKRFVGFGNFVELFGTEEFWTSVRNSVVITIATIVIQIVLAFCLALLLRRRFRGRAIVRALYILPWPLPTFIAAFAFVWMLDYNYGIVNHILAAIDLPRIAFLGNPSTALPSVILANVWKELPWTFVVITAAMALVSHDLLEATRIDGGNWWSEIRYVMIPAMRPILTLIVILRVIWTFNFFDLVYLMTGGGPNNSTMVLPVLMYQMLFQSFQIGSAAAIGALMVVVLGAFAFVLLWHRARTER